MNLLNDKDTLNELALAASDYYKIQFSLIEKDFYVTEVLRELSNRNTDFVFRGGTSLSKCHHVIDRFSEDIDITLEKGNTSVGVKRRLKEDIISTCNSLKLPITNLETIRSRRDYNLYEVEYQKEELFSGLNPKILIETTYMEYAYPCCIKDVNSIIYSFLNEIGRFDLIEKYDLKPFSIRTVALERTFIDKTFAICDYYLRGKTERLSRHIYDLYKLSSLIIFDNKFKELVEEIRNERKINPRCVSAYEEMSINDILRRIIDENYYKHDYDSITSRIIYEDIKYENAIPVLETIINSNLF